ncbi:hypothetical protein RFI_08364 [Reticulomyxa filosa]|uniref:Uncharacterized protein n=1 Tax=Reticulomyxa filosa TaxID=46433 RepID=X6NRW9_RETFI|nr:hypothetical protein RFI_08364 [Reticulomyxa filosa]|eukprot:ETO28761.1 hypothetical protein RFI_08364 [Reticulomyxa filosa]
MSLFKAYMNDGEKICMITLSDLTMEHLKRQILQATQLVQEDDVLITIIDGDGNSIENDESVIHAFKSDLVKKNWYQIEDVPKAKGVEEVTIKKKEEPEALDFKKHWNKNWRKSNAEAVKAVEQMMHNNEQGLIIVAYNTLKWQIKNDNLYSIINLVDNKNEDIKEFGMYCMYVIKKKQIVLEDVNIDGNVYAIDCELQCKGYVNISTQLFVTKNAVIDKQLKQSIEAIQWNTKIHHDIPIQFQKLDDKGEECKRQKLFDDSIVHWQTYLQTAIDMFGHNHHYVAIAYNFLGAAYFDKRRLEKALQFYEKTLTIILNMFGINCNFVASLYENLGSTFDEMEQYDKAIECHEKAFGIRTAIFGAKHVDVASSYSRLGKIYQNKKEYDKATEYYEKALKIKLEIFGANYEDIFDLYNKLGNVYSNKGYYNKAIECYENSLRIRKSISKNAHRSTANIFWNLGLIFEKLKGYKIACKYFEEAWMLYSTVLGESNGETLQAKRKVKFLNIQINSKNGIIAVILSFHFLACFFAFIKQKN